MDSPEAYFLALSNILRSDEWTGVVRKFVETHCELFDLQPGEEFGHGHYSLWREFHAIAEQLIDKVTSSLSLSFSLPLPV